MTAVWIGVLGPAAGGEDAGISLLPQMDVLACNGVSQPSLFMQAGGSWVWTVM